MRGVFKVEGSTEDKIENGWDGSRLDPYPFESLKAAPGDLIKFNCYNYDGGSFGAGCFVLSNKCHCFNFDTTISRRNNNEQTRSHTFNNSIECKMTDIQNLSEDDNEGTYHLYEHIIPLNASSISCQNTDNVLFVQYGENIILNLTNYIIADFELKNLEVIITENFKYFYLNDIPLTANKPFKILNDIKFNSKESKKIIVKFENLGIYYNNTKECKFSIRVCHERCLECLDINISKNNHQCIKCRDGFYIVEYTNNCKTKQEIDLAKYYLNETEKMFKLN